MANHGETDWYGRGVRLTINGINGLDGIFCCTHNPTHNGNLTMTYDQWKLASPDDNEDECDHEEYEVDIIVGRAHCCKCSYSWWQTNEEIEAEVQRIAEYDEWQRQQERRERWDRLTSPFRWAWYRVMQRLWPRKSLKFLDEIPF